MPAQNPETVTITSALVMASQNSSRFSSSSVDTVRVSREGMPGVVEIALDQLTHRQLRVFSVRKFFC